MATDLIFWRPVSYGTPQGRKDFGEYAIVQKLFVLNADIFLLAPSSVTRSYYRGAAGAILVYDITRFATLSAMLPTAVILGF